MDFRAIVASAVAIESQANFVNCGDAPSGSAPTCGNAIFFTRQDCQTSIRDLGRAESATHTHTLAETTNAFPEPAVPNETCPVGRARNPPLSPLPLAGR